MKTLLMFLLFSTFSLSQTIYSDTRHLDKRDTSSYKSSSRSSSSSSYKAGSIGLGAYYGQLSLMLDEEGNSIDFTTYEVSFAGFSLEMGIPAFESTVPTALLGVHYLLTIPSPSKTYSYAFGGYARTLEDYSSYGLEAEMNYHLSIFSAGLRLGYGANNIYEDTPEIAISFNVGLAI